MKPKLTGFALNSWIGASYLYKRFGVGVMLGLGSYIRPKTLAVLIPAAPFFSPKAMGYGFSAMGARHAARKGVQSTASKIKWHNFAVGATIIGRMRAKAMEDEKKDGKKQKKSTTKGGFKTIRGGN
jgi:hypothetical protein